MKSLFKKAITIILAAATVASSFVIGSASPIETQDEFATNVANASTDAYWAITEYKRPDANQEASLTVSIQMKEDVDDDPQSVQLVILSKGTYTFDSGVAKLYAADTSSKKLLNSSVALTTMSEQDDTQNITDYDSVFGVDGASALLPMPAEGLNYTFFMAYTKKTENAYSRMVITFKFTGCSSDFNPIVSVTPVSKDFPNTYSLVGDNNTMEGYSLQTRWLSVPQSSTITYALSDSGKANATLPFTTADVTIGQPIGTDNVPLPTITSADLANGWKLDSYTMSGTKYSTPEDLAAVVVSADASVTVNVIQDKNGNGINDADEVKVVFALRKGYNGIDDKGTLSFTEKIFDKTKVSILGADNIPTVSFTAAETAEGWSFNKEDGFYIDGIKYTSAQLATLALDKAEIKVEVRTKLDNNGNGKDDRDEDCSITVFDDKDNNLGTLDIPYNKPITVTDENGNLFGGATDENGNVVPNPYPVKEDGTIKLPVPPTKAGYEFSGWDIVPNPDGSVNIKPKYELPGSLLDDKYSNELIVKLDYCEAFTTKGLDNDGTSYDKTNNILTMRFAPTAQKPTYKYTPTFNFANLLKDKTQVLTWEITEIRTAVTFGSPKVAISGMNVTVNGSVAYKCVGKNAIGQSVTLYLITPGDAKADHILSAADCRQVMLAIIDGNVDTKLNKVIYDSNNDTLVSAPDCRAVMMAMINRK